MTKYRLTRIVGLLCIALTIVGCSKDIAPSFSDNGDMKAGDPVMFTTHMSGKATTRGAYDGWGSAEGYTFTYFMYKKVENVSTFVAKGSTVYWPDINTNAYGFKAMTGTLKEGVTDGAFAELAANQSTEASLINEDQLLGFGAASNDIITELNYRTGTAWKSANYNDGITGENQKKIRLYMQHQRAKITIILKAGVGVLRSTLENASNINMTIYSYKGATPTITEISPYASTTTVNYDAADYGGAADNVLTTKYQAIVDPYDYRTGEGKNIAQITVGGRTFTYKPSNDPSEDKSAYNLAAGKHLTITITLSPGAAMSASVTDWTVSYTDATLGPDSN